MISNSFVLPDVSLGVWVLILAIAWSLFFQLIFNEFHIVHDLYKFCVKLLDFLFLLLSDSLEPLFDTSEAALEVLFGGLQLADVWLLLSDLVSGFLGEQAEFMTDCSKEAAVLWTDLHLLVGDVEENYWVEELLVLFSTFFGNVCELSFKEGNFEICTCIIFACHGFCTFIDSWKSLHNVTH